MHQNNLFRWSQLEKRGFYLENLIKKPCEFVFSVFISSLSQVSIFHPVKIFYQPMKPISGSVFLFLCRVRKSESWCGNEYKMGK